METSIFLAKVIGLISVVSAAAVISRYKKNIAFEAELAQNPAVTYVSGFAILILGVLIVVSHSIWTLDWRLVITIIGWAVLLKGVGRIFFPEAVKNMIEKKKSNYKFIFGEVVVFLAGVYLLYYGFVVY